jgi:FlaG/FlaF family flagellin (archaellin)
METVMRSLILAAASAVILTACASSSPTNEKTTAAPAPAPTKAAQCYSSDHSKFFDIGSKTTISGVDVVCQATADGKGAQWMGVKAKH